MDRIKLFRWQLALSRLSSQASVSPAWYRPALRQHLSCLFMCLSSLFAFCSEEKEEAKVIPRKKRRLYRGRSEGMSHLCMSLKRIVYCSEGYTEEEAKGIQRKKRRLYRGRSEGLSYVCMQLKRKKKIAAKVIQRKKRRLYRGRSENYTEEEANVIQRKKRRSVLSLHEAEKNSLLQRRLYRGKSEGYTEEEAKECPMFACSCKEQFIALAKGSQSVKGMWPQMTTVVLKLAASVHRLCCK